MIRRLRSLRRHPRVHRRWGRVMQAAVGMLLVTMLAAQCGTERYAPATAIFKPVFDDQPSAAQCEQRAGKRCYTAEQMRIAYGVDALHARGTTGQGITVAILDDSGAPGLRGDLVAFSRRSALPQPNLRITTHGGVERVFDPTDSRDTEAAIRTRAAAQMVHAFAPGAEIVIDQIGLDTVAAADAEGETLAQEAHRRAGQLNMRVHRVLRDVQPDVLLIGWGIPEVLLLDSVESMDRLRNLDAIFRDAAEAGVTVIAPAGDRGPAPLRSHRGDPVRSVLWPASSPRVVAVGGIDMSLDDTGRRLKRDRAWYEDGVGSGGGGPSAVFGRPDYQASVHGVVGGKRGIPDVAMPASGHSAVAVFQRLGDEPGWVLENGTHVGAAMFAGLIAMSAQLAGGGLGVPHETLYAVAAAGGTGIVPITEGGTGGDYGAVAGFDLATGLGTVRAGALVPALAAGR